jgi:putative transposase
VNRKIIFSEGEFYHVYNRGNDKRLIFLENSDYKRFVNLLFFCNSKNSVQMAKLLKKLNQGVTLTEFLETRGDTLVDIGAYCLMPNHFHMLLHEKVGNGITMFLRKLCTAYSMYFNIKNDRVGKLFEGVFQARHADSDRYLKYLFSYIHLNPVKIIEPSWKESGLKDLENAKNFVEKYQFSSYRDYLNHRTKNDFILNKSAFPGYFEDGDIRDEVDDWLNFNPTALVKVSP